MAASGVRFWSCTAPKRRLADHASTPLPNVVDSGSGATNKGVLRVSSARVNATAPAALISPAPCVSTSTPASGVAEYSRIALIAYGFNGADWSAVRLASITNAATPVATAVAMLDPLNRTYCPDHPGNAAKRNSVYLL